MSQDFGGPVSFRLPGQSRLDPGELLRLLEKVIEDAPSPLKDGDGPLSDDVYEWIGDASALVSELGDISLGPETSNAVNALTSGKRAMGFQKLMVLVHKARALAKLEATRHRGRAAETSSVISRAPHLDAAVTTPIVGPTGSGDAPAAPLGPNGTTGPGSRAIGQPPMVAASQAAAPYRAEAVEFAAGGEDRPEVLHQTLIARVAVLEAAVEELRGPTGIGIGHNRPPPDEEAFVPVTPDDLDQIDRLIVLLKEQPPAPTTVSPQLADQTRVVSKIGAKITDYADIYAKEVVKSAGQETGKRLVQLPFWLGFASLIAGVASALQIWLSVLPR